MLYNESMHSLIGLLDSSHVFIYRWIIFETAKIRHFVEIVISAHP